MRLVLLGMAVCGIFVAVIGSAVAAQDSTLRQFITAVDCDHMTVETGSGIVNNIDCPYFPPAIEKITVQQSKIIVTGIYDAVHMTMLRVQFQGVWYEYGVDPELTTNGNMWRIEFQREDFNLEPGDYSVVVQSTDEHGTVQQDSGNVVVPVEELPIDGNEGGVAKPRPEQTLIPGIPNTGIGRASLAGGILIAAAVLAMACVTLLDRLFAIVIVRKNRRK